MLLVTLLACAPPPWGTWMFTRYVTADTGDECATTVTHNLSAAREPTPPVEDESWTSATDLEVSPEVFFGRIEETNAGSAILIVGSEALPGDGAEDGTWMFAWTGTTASETDSAHASGYAISTATDEESTFWVSGSFESGTFNGTWETDSYTIQSWTESDLWSEEAAVTVGEHGEIPTATYLVTDDGAGGEIPAENGRTVAECATDGCALALESACTYAYELTGQLTNFEPDDSRWVEDAGQPAGAE